MESKTKRAVIACIVAWVVLHNARADACQVCVAIGLYDGLRFGVIWFYLLPLWAAITLVADWRMRRISQGDKIKSVSFLKNFLNLLFVVTAIGLLGAHFLALLAFPFLLIPYAVPLSWLKKETSREMAALAPPWLRSAAKAMMAVLLLSVVPSYFAFPVVPTEAQTRSKVSRSRTDMRQMSALLEGYQERSQAYPFPRVERRGNITLSTVDLEVLRKAMPDLPEQRYGPLPQDPFYAGKHLSYKRLSPFAAWPMFFPYSLMSVREFRLPAARSDLAEYLTVDIDGPMADKIQYWSDGSIYVLWSRGPDTVFSPGFLEAARLSKAGSTTASVALNQMTYDPTNGTVSAGEIYRIGPDKPFDRRRNGG